MANNSNNRRRNNNNNRRRFNNRNRNRNNYNNDNNNCNQSNYGQGYNDNSQGYNDNSNQFDNQSDNHQFDDSYESNDNIYNNNAYDNYDSDSGNQYNYDHNDNNKRGRGSVCLNYEDDSRANPNTGAGAKNKRRKKTATGSKGQPRVNGPRPQTCASSFLSGMSATGSTAETGAATTTATADSTCQHSMCIELARQGLQRTHADARCFRFTNPKRFESILRQRRRDGLVGLSGKEHDVRPVAVSGAHNPSTHVNEDDDLKISDYLYMKDSSFFSNDAEGGGFPHPTTWRYMFDEGGEESSSANNHDGSVAAASINGSTQTLAQPAAQMSRSARQRARRAARKAEAKDSSNSNNAINVGGNGSSLNASKQQPQIPKQTHAATAPTRACVIDGRGALAWNEDTDEWDRPLNILEAIEVLADMDRLNWESQQTRLFNNQSNTGDLSKRAVSVHTGTSPNTPLQQQTKKSTIVGGFRGKKPGDNRIAVPVKVNGVVLTALLVTGRINSCIDCKVAEAIELRVWSDPDLKMVDHYRTPKTMHTCSPVSVSYGDKSGKFVLDVDDLHYYDFQIGIDLTRTFSFFPTGIIAALN